MRLLVRSFVYCVLATGARAQSSNVTIVYPPMQSPPVVVILRGRPAPQEEYEPTRQITYLIAFKNDGIRVADQYWVSGRTLYYLTPDHQRRTAPVDSVDRTLSRQLNSEQNVAFILPAERERVSVHVVRRTASVVRKRCYCVAVPSAGAASRARGGANRASPQ
jgi:hypothetical protein